MLDRIHIVKVSFLFVLLLFISCKPSVNKEVTQESMDGTVLKIVSDLGEMINPVFQDTSTFVGCPGYIAVNEDKSDVSLVLGKFLSNDSDVTVKRIATFSYKINDNIRKMNLVLPVEKKYQSFDFDEQLSFNIDYNNLKLWIQDWIQNAYGNKNVIFLGWH